MPHIEKEIVDIPQMCQMCQYTLSESFISLGNPLFALFYAHTQQDWILETGIYNEDREEL